MERGKRKKKTNGKYTVLTIRIDPNDKRRLKAYCLQQSQKRGGYVSYNEVVLDLIRRAVA